MTPADVNHLTSPMGQRLLALAATTRDVPAHQRPARLLAAGTEGVADPGALVRLVLTQDRLRIGAGRKVPAHAEQLLFDPEALEQATAWPVAAERALRWDVAPTDLLTDLTAGQGLDALAAACAGQRVRAVERDPARAALLRENARRLGLSDRFEIIEGDAERLALGGPLGFLDPARRSEGRRTRDPVLFSPGLETWAPLLARFDRAMLKLGPGLPPLGCPEPFEVVSLGGRARETRLFHGDWDVPPRRALSLPAGTSIAGTGCAWPAPRDPGVGDDLLDPDASVVLAGLVGDLAVAHGLQPVHPRIAYLTGARDPGTADKIPGTWLRIEAVLPARARDLSRWLVAAEIGNLTIRTRGTKDPVEAWRRRLRPRGPRSGTLVITRRANDQWVAYGCAE